MASTECDLIDFNLLALPLELLERIVSYLSYDNISSVRSVCKSFDKVCQSRLNCGCQKILRLQKLIYDKYWAQLPKRESARYKDPLMGRCSALQTVRYSLEFLYMMYNKYECCFIPGKVLDEAFKIIRSVQSDAAYKLHQSSISEFCDLKGLAKDHFEKEIEPLLKLKMPDMMEWWMKKFAFTSTEDSLVQNVVEQPSKKARLSEHSECVKRVLVLTRQVRRLKTSHASVAHLAKHADSAFRLLSRKVKKQSRIIGCQKAKLAEYDQKFRHILAELDSFRSHRENSVKKKSMGQDVFDQSVLEANNAMTKARVASIHAKRVSANNASNARSSNDVGVGKGQRKYKLKHLQTSKKCH